MSSKEKLVPAKELAAKNRAKFPNETAQYRQARNELLSEEIELRRHIERVNEMRRGLPLGGEVNEDYGFIGERGPVTLSELFGRHQALVLYSYMFGPRRKRPCPMCSSLMSAFEAKIEDVQQKVAIAFVARSPIERLIEAKKERGWKNVPVFSYSVGDYTRAYVSRDDDDVPAYTVFTKKAGKIYHFWSGEMSHEMSDPGQDPRGAPDMDPLWNLLDTTPEGRGQWYPKLEYDPS